MKTITAKNLAPAVGPYCHAKLVGETLYCSGQLGVNPETGKLEEGVEAQAEQALKNLGEVLRAAGMEYGNVVKTTIFLAHISHFSTINAVYARYFQGEFPARSCVEVGNLPTGGLFEIEAIACK